MPSDTLTITDNRTGKTYELPITDETIKATDLRQMKTDPADFGLMPYDPSFMFDANDCIRAKEKAYTPDGGLAILYGQLAPEPGATTRGRSWEIPSSHLAR